MRCDEAVSTQFQTIREERPVRLEIARAVTEAVVQNIPINSELEVMDYGCGTGLVTLALASKCASVTAVETSTRQLEILDEKIVAGRIKNVTTCCFDMERQPWHGGCFHLIIISMTLHHIEDTESILNKLAGALHPGGYLVIADLDLEDGSFHDGRPGVAHFGFDRTALQQSLQRSMLSVVSNETVLEIKKKHAGGREQNYPMFVMCAKKQSA